MPFHQEFDELYGRGEISVRPNGWTPLVVEYGYGNISQQKNFYWRVKGTRHTFRISYQSLNELSHGDYGNHIEYALENFRQEYLSWAAGGFTEEWMVEYHQEYRNYLEI